MLRSLAALAVAHLALGAAACAEAPSEDGVCRTDDDCGQYRRCNTGTGACVCTSDDACDVSEFCNVAGKCQPKLDCLTNVECKSPDNPSAICDVGTGQCLTLDAVVVQCAADQHCPFGQFCEGQQCVVGCRDNGDCPLGQPCMGGACDPAPNACNQDGYCEFGQYCGGETCATHDDADTLCQRCRGDEANPGCDVCLIDNTVPLTLCDSDNDCAQGYCVHQFCFGDDDCTPGETCGFGGCSGHCGDFFCGNDSCDPETDPCPRGYYCAQVVLVSNNTCTRNGGECDAPATCSADSGEGNASGFCSCLADADCPQGLECVNPGPNGGCLYGTTCAPQEGNSCEELR